MKRTLINMNIAAAIIAMSAATTATAAEFMDGKVKIGGAAMQAWQTGFGVDGNAATVGNVNTDSGFHRMRFALNINAQISENVSVFAELAEEPGDGGSPGAITQDLGWIQFDLPNNTGVRLGNTVSTTQSFIRYSDGAAVQGNPFVGNGITDMITAEEGLWAYGSHDLESGTNVTWDAVLATPDFFSDFDDGTGYNLGLRGTVNFESGLSFGAGAFSTNSDVESVHGKKGYGSLIALGDGDLYEFADTLVGGTHPVIVPGIDAFVWQADVQYKTGNFFVHALYGEAEDDYSYTGSNTYADQKSKMEFWSVEGKYDINQDFYVAARYGEVSNESAGVSGPNKSDRIQLAAGYWMNDSTLIKAEYVKQQEDQFSGGAQVDSSVAGGANWDGFIVETSVTF